MMSLGHVTSSGACPNDSPRAIFYRLSIGTIPSSGFVSEIISFKVVTDYYVMTSSVTSYSQDQLSVRVHKTYHTENIAGEEAFYIKIMTSPS